MAKIYITEHTDMTVVYGNLQPVVKLPPLATQAVTSSGSSAQSAVFNAKTKIIQVHTDGICSIEVGANPTATTNSLRLAANTTTYYEVNPGDRLAYITNT